MKMEVMIDGVAYPCYPTMGALVRVERVLGYVPEQFSTLGENCAYLYGCVASASAREKREFGLSFDEFCDSVDIEEMTRWMEVVRQLSAADEARQTDAVEQKKSKPSRR